MRLPIPALMAAAVMSAFAVAAPANATTNLIFTTPTSAIFYNSPTPSSFTDVFDLNASQFGALKVGQQIKISISGTSAGAVTLSNVTFNGGQLPITANATGPTGNLTSLTGASNILRIIGTSTGTGGYTGTISVNSVPETATWGMLVVGFGAIGGALRSRRRAARLIAA